MTPLAKHASGVSQETNGAASPESTALLALLRSEGIDAALIAPGCPMPTVARAAAAIGVSEEQIVKSLLFQDAGGRLVLAIAAGTARVDRRLLAKAAQLDRPRLADPATVLDATGYPAGGVPPVGHRTAIPVVIDRRAAALAIAGMAVREGRASWRGDACCESC